MKYSPVLLLGLMSLTFGSTAASAQDILQLEPSISSSATSLDPSYPAGTYSVLGSDAIPANGNPESNDSSAKDLAPFDVGRRDQPPAKPDRPTASDETESALPDLPLFDLPAFQAPSSNTTTRRSQPPPPSPPPSPPISPFSFPDSLSDEDLFEPDSAKTVVGLDFTPPPAKVESPDPSDWSPVPFPPTAVPSPPSTTEPEHPAEPESEPTVPPPAVTSLKDVSLDALFAGDADSLVAIAVGSAEGTRTPNGTKNPAYYGHTDPGNGVWNLGSFSYQHGAASPEEADAKQLVRLRAQAEIILQKAEALGLVLSLEEKLNAIDLANQAPKAVLDRSGYIDWLAEAHKRGMTGSDAILWARVQSFIDPHTQTWDAPGLGNSESRITRDQERRMLEIAKAIHAYPNSIAQPPAERSTTNRNQVSHRLLSEAEGIARLFAQPFTALLGSGTDTLLPEL